MKKTIFMILTMIFLSACGKAEDKSDAGLWEVRIEGLQWGMSKEQIQEQYSCAEEAGLRQVIYLTIKEPMETAGVSAKAVLTVDEELGLIAVTYLTEKENYEALGRELGERFSGYRTGAQPQNGVSYKSEPVMDRYEQEELQAACDQVLGEGVMEESWLKGRMGSPLVSCELIKTQEGCRLTIDATVKGETEYILSASEGK